MEEVLFEQHRLYGVSLITMINTVLLGLVSFVYLLVLIILKLI